MHPASYACPRCGGTKIFAKTIVTVWANDEVSHPVVYDLDPKDRAACNDCPFSAPLAEFLKEAV